MQQGLIQRWIRVTDTAMHEQPSGFPGFKSSPVAFFMDAIQNERMPPNWIYSHEKEQERRQWESHRQTMASDEASLRTRYQAERTAALETYLLSPEGRSHYQKYFPTFLEFYRTVEPDRFQGAARTAAIGKVEREHSQFQDFGVWLLDQHSTHP